MDCGPAALKAVLQGFGVDVHYEWLRDRCQTDVDGTSIDALAALGQELGLATAEMVVPHDSFLLPEADCLPAIVVKRGAGDTLHFVVVWRRLGPFVQILDPGSGRRWVHGERFMEDMPHFPIPISIERWRRWVSSEDSLGPLRAKLRALGVSGAGGEASSPGPTPTRGGGRSRRSTPRCGWRRAWSAAARSRAGRGAARARGRLRPGARRGGGRYAEGVLLGDGGEGGGEAPRARRRHRALRPARGRRGRGEAPPWARARAAARAAALAERTPPPPSYRGSAAPPAAPAEQAPRAVATAVLPAPVRRELEQPTPSPSRLFFWMLRADAGRALALVFVALAASAAIAAIDVVVLRGLFDAVKHITVDYQRALGLLALVAFAAGGLLLELFAAHAVSRLGRALEVRFRAAFLEKLPRLEDRYLRSRPTSDMTARGHAMHLMREAPALFSRIARAGLSFAATLLGVVWLYPGGARLSLVAAAVALVAPYLARRPLVESLMRLRTHAASLERFYLDALLGVVPIRVHGAERAVRREHEALLVEWARTGRLVHAQSTAMQAVQGLASTAVAVAIVGGYVVSGGAGRRRCSCSFSGRCASRWWRRSSSRRSSAGRTCATRPCASSRRWRRRRWTCRATRARTPRRAPRAARRKRRWRVDRPAGRQRAGGRAHAAVRRVAERPGRGARRDRGELGRGEVDAALAAARVAPGGPGRGARRRAALRRRGARAAPPRDGVGRPGHPALEPHAPREHHLRPRPATPSRAAGLRGPGRADRACSRACPTGCRRRRRGRRAPLRRRGAARAPRAGDDAGDARLVHPRRAVPRARARAPPGAARPRARALAARDARLRHPRRRRDARRSIACSSWTAGEWSRTARRPSSLRGPARATAPLGRRGRAGATRACWTTAALVAGATDGEAAAAAEAA